MKTIIIAVIALLLGSADIEAEVVREDPIRLAVAGLSHDHVHWIFGRENRGDIEIAGIYESNQELAERYAGQYELAEELFFTELEEMLDAVEPEAVSAFGSIYEHLAVVEACAPRGVHVMVEKPLAVSLEHALAMQELAEEHDIHLLTNYETTWYATTEAAYDVAHKENAIGDLRKIVVQDGHRGPEEIGVSDEFLEWLTDPEQNGGGALMDFGCYGANLITWLMNGEEPLSVSATTQQIKPDIYPEVDDEATIIVTYPETQGIIQASWNWPINRKDMQVYGRTGYVYAEDDMNLRVRPDEQSAEEARTLELREPPYDDPFSYLAAVVRGEIEVADTDLSSLENNVTVVRILDAARESARTGRTMYLDEER